LSYLIIGNGIAGVTAAEILRTYDTTSMITIVADDPFPVYYRPALKDYLGGKVKEEKLWARPSTFYQQQRVRFVPGRVLSINTTQHAVYLQNRQQLVYDKLLLANGAYPRHINCPGLNLAGVSTLRSVADYQQIVSRLVNTERVVVCGSGTLALESAETLNHLGYQVTHLLRNSTLWSEVLDATASDLVLQEERRAGIDVRIQEEIREIVGANGQVTGIVTTSGAHIPCEMVLIAIGVEPNIDFIRSSGIVCGRGVHIDATMRTSMSDIYAAGDVLEVIDTTTRRPRVLGQWYPAIEQARIAAHSMLGQQYAATTGTFYNATFLHGLDFVGLGVTTHYTGQHLQEAIAAPQPQNYRKVVLHNGTPVGAILLGNRKNALALKRAIDHHVHITPIVHRLFADDFNLDDWLDGQVGARLIAPTVGTHNVEGESIPNDGRAEAGPYEASPVHTNTTVLRVQRFQQPHVITDTMRLIPAQLRNTLPDTPTLVLLAQNAAPQVVSLTQKKRFLLGRDKQNDIYLDDSATSRKHAELVATAGGFYVRDLGSSNGVIVNKQKITEPRHLIHEDTIVIGNMLLYFSSPPAQKEQPVAGLIHRNDVQTLSKERIHFEIDMCIGCDRCMVACPLPMSSMVNIADLNAATVTDNIAEHVMRFTHECIMCGSCVPVCPVDNHRDLLMLSLKQRIGVSWEQPIALQQIASKLPTGWTPQQLLSRLREQAPLRNKQSLSDNYLCHLFMASQLLIEPAGTTLIREGEYGRDLYFLLDGQCSAFTTESDGKELPLAVMQRGEYVGEYGMLTGQQHPATVRTQTPALLLQVPEQVMQRLTELVPQVHHFFDKLNSARSLTAILKRMALFQGVSDTATYALCEQAQVKLYDRNERLFAENNRGRPARETLHVLLEGFVKVARHKSQRAGTMQDGERIIAYRQGGDYFAGGLDLLGDSRAVTVTAINRTRVAEIPRQALLALFQRYPDVNQRFTVRLREYIESTTSTNSAVFEPGFLQQHIAPPNVPADPHAKVGLHSLVQDGVVEGTEVLVIDLDACIHCNECEEACARRHGQSRMNRKGMVVGNISIATACRQCQDPVCMLCSRAGIARLPDGEVYITESCIGCGICAERCPYGAISIVNVSDTIEAPSSWQTFSNIFKHGVVKERKRKELPMANITSGGVRVAPGPLDSAPTRSGYEELRKKIAIKCDLCAGYSDQACVQSCPTGAAIRVKPTTFFGSTEDILQR
jgi:NADPH-dependent 2,4-dienoyl-CoA reductase/sulfur reductase-like enzyme/CRP-like cAMP-binding protein/Fe-S-cluster-containing hydrogenase component 2